MLITNWICAELHTVAARLYSKVVLFHVCLGTLSPCLVSEGAVRGRTVSRNDGDKQLSWNNWHVKSRST